MTWNSSRIFLMQLSTLWCLWGYWDAYISLWSHMCSSSWGVTLWWCTFQHSKCDWLFDNPTAYVQGTWWQPKGNWLIYLVTQELISWCPNQRWIGDAWPVPTSSPWPMYLACRAPPRGRKTFWWPVHVAAEGLLRCGIPWWRGWYPIRVLISGWIREVLEKNLF
jgi:hypothetical protein